MMRPPVVGTVTCRISGTAITCRSGIAGQRNQESAQGPQHQVAVTRVWRSGKCAAAQSLRGHFATVPFKATPCAGVWFEEGLGGTSTGLETAKWPNGKNTWRKTTPLKALPARLSQLTNAAQPLRSCTRSWGLPAELRPATAHLLCLGVTNAAAHVEAAGPHAVRPNVLLGVGVPGALNGA
jgi:hypothetical protein